MKKARINTVTLGVFSWSVLEPEEDHYHFQWLIDTINRLYENGIQVILATPSGARPRWLAEKYPEVLRVREDRVRYHYGERHISNEYRDECHCPLCQKAFRVWLKKKYHTIDALNHAWWTTFWSHTYNSFDQIESPSSIGDKGLHGLNLDWKRFRFYVSRNHCSS